MSEMNDRMLVIVSAWLVNEQPNACNRLVTWEMSACKCLWSTCSWILIVFIIAKNIYYQEPHLFPCNTFFVATALRFRGTAIRDFRFGG